MRRPQPSCLVDREIRIEIFVDPSLWIVLKRERGTAFKRMLGCLGCNGARQSLDYGVKKSPQTTNSKRGRTMSAPQDLREAQIVL